MANIDIQRPGSNNYGGKKVIKLNAKNIGN